jgi:broad specificity phosphatase PhoE
MKELYFVRHGQTEWNAIRRMQGQWNSDLSELGREQAETNGKFLATLDIDHIVVSPLDRTRQTADIINQHLGLKVHYDDRIKEWDCGDWSGEMWDEVSAKWPEQFAAWQADQFNYRGPNCENYPDMIDRAKPFLHELDQTPHNRIAIISHGMIGRVMVACLLGFGPQQMFEFGQPNDTVFHLTQTDNGYISQHFIGGNGPHGGLPPRQY